MTAVISHGRGGAGNMGSSSNSPKLTAKDLITPTLKTAYVTTGRGGTGNMALNKDPAETRLRQDVEAPPRRRSSGAMHSGRGGAGNVFRAEDVPARYSDYAVDDNSSRKSSEFENLAAKGKQWLLGRK